MQPAIFHSIYFYDPHESCVHNGNSQSNNVKRMPKHMFLTMVQLAFSWVCTIFSEFPMSHFNQKIVCVPIAEIVGVTFFTCWCVEFHGESNPPYKLGVTSAVSSNHYSCYIYIYIYIYTYITNRMGYCGVQHGLSIKHGERLPK